MKRVNLILGLVLLFAIACNSEKKGESADTSSVASSDTTAKPVDTAAMNKAWADYMTPGDSHKMLAKADGRWDAEISFYYNPDSPSVNKVVCESKMILGGRYQQSTYKGSIDGIPFEGINTLAYDNARKIYISTWVDNMGTGIMYMEGTYDAATKTMNFKGKATDVVSGNDIALREVFKMVDDKTQAMEMYETKDGKEMKTMSILLKKK
ncbi:DUF1579 domain-containing protein [Pedobacter sp. Du54]|uniref:DUF1579 domain-containing protein n=1 Tax=Pedobacter anseongensis TaxID=3133439 RepID=UPI0030AE8A0E